MTESGRMHRKAEENAALGANGDDDNTARRRAGPSGATEYLRARPLVPGAVSLPLTALGRAAG